MSLRKFERKGQPGSDAAPAGDQDGVILDSWKRTAAAQEDMSMNNGEDRQSFGRESLNSVAERFRARNDPPRAGEEAAPPATSTTADRVPSSSDASVVDRHSTFDGKFETAQDLRIEGTISGEIVCRGVLSIAREAVAKVKVNAREVYIEGQLEGEITCDGKLTLADTAVVKGTFRATTLVMLEGAVLNGTVNTGEGADQAGGRSSRNNRRAEREASSRDSDSVPQPTFALNRAANEEEASA